jgi:hypothetical protein
VAEPRRALAVLFAIFALVLTGCGSGSQEPPVSGVSGGDNDGYHGTHLEDPYVVPDITLTDADGKPYSLAKDSAPLKVVFFGYTNCPDICQAVMSTIASAVSRLDADQRDKVEVVFVTTDPARDTGPKLPGEVRPRIRRCHRRPEADHRPGRPAQGLHREGPEAAQRRLRRRPLDVRLRHHRQPGPHRLDPGHLAGRHGR